MGLDGERRKSYSAAVIDGCESTSTIYVGDSIVRKTDRRLGKGKDVVVCLPGARIEHVTERVEKIMGRGKGGTIMVHVGTNNADKEGTTAIVDKYRNLLKKTKEARVGQIILSGILPVFGNMIDGYRNSKRMAINGMMKRLCKEEDVGYVDLWDSFVGKEDMYVRDGLHQNQNQNQKFIYLNHIVLYKNKYFNLNSNYKTWIGRPLLRPSGRYRRGHQNYNINYY